MNKLASTIIVFVGTAMVILGILAMDSFNSDVSRFFTGSPTDKSVWLFVGGVIAIIAGGSGALFSSTQTK